LQNRKPYLDIPPNISHVIELAWCDKASFEAIKKETGLAEKQVIAVMRRHLKSSSFKLWRERVAGRKAKHLKKQKTISDKQPEIQPMDFHY
jgi:uncharacterized protein (TIGR03643 family)